MSVHNLDGRGQTPFTYQVLPSGDPAWSVLDALRAALEASWDGHTSHQAVHQAGSPAWGQCYPTSRLVQHFLPQAEIAQGKVWTGEKSEDHFWNALRVDGALCHMDLTWQQFPPGSYVQEFSLRDRHSLGDSAATSQRCDLLRQRVTAHLHQAQ